MRAKISQSNVENLILYYNRWCSLRYTNEKGLEFVYFIVLKILIEQALDIVYFNVVIILIEHALTFNVVMINQITSRQFAFRCIKFLAW